MNPLIDVLAARVHDSYVRAKWAAGVDSLPSRHGTGDLMRPYAELADVDREDDRRTVQTVLQGLAEMPWVDVCRLLLSLRDDAGLLAELRGAYDRLDPAPARLVDDCVEVATREDGQP